jgi:surfeit locus 1 family protein
MTIETKQARSTQPITAKARRGKLIATASAVLLTLAILLTLGTWQVERLHWKERLLADIAERRATDPVPLAQIERQITAGENIEYSRVSLSGTFDHGKERHFFATFEGQTGFFVYTPLMLADGRALFVNRGFVPYEMKDPATRPQGQVTGEQHLTGYARTPLIQKPSMIVPDNVPEKNMFYWKDIGAMASSAGIESGQLVAIFVDVDASVTNPGGWPKGGVTLFDMPNNHLQYAVTWFGLAFVLAAMVCGMWWRSRRPGAARR